MNTAIVREIIEGVIAVVVVVLGLGIIGWKPVMNNQAPDSTTVAIVLPLITLVVGRYFGTRTATDVRSGIETATNGMMTAAAKISEATAKTTEQAK